MTTYYQPVLGKMPPNEKKDHKPMTWERLLQLRAWAKWIAWREKCTVALVGSVLEKTVPRDIDVALIWPVAQFEAKFGPVPLDKEGYATLKGIWDYQYGQHALWVSANVLVGYETRIDVRVCPDVWWPEKDRLILATPTDTEPPNSWDGKEFQVYEIAEPEGEEA